jgi:hypothetical protein
LQNIRGSDSFVDSRSQNRIISQLLVLLTEIREMLIVALGMKHREEDKDEQTLHTNYRAKAVIGYLMKRRIFLS